MTPGADIIPARPEMPSPVQAQPVALGSEEGACGPQGIGQGETWLRVGPAQVEKRGRSPT